MEMHGGVVAGTTEGRKEGEGLLGRKIDPGRGNMR